MTKIFTLFFILSAGLCFAHDAISSDGWSDSGVRGPSYATILAMMEGLHAEYPELTTVIDYGKSVEGRTLRLLLVMKNRSELDVSTHPTFLMSGSTHGNEYLHIEDRLPGALLKDIRAGGDVAEFINRGGALVFIPILNPDGYEHHTRENVHGVDLNRDWDLQPAGYHGFKEVETRALAAALENLRVTYQLEYRVTVDYHCCIGALLHPWAFRREKMPEADLARHQAIGEMASRLLNIDVGATGEVLGYLPLGTTKDYYYSHFGALSFTFEGRHGVEDKKFNEHLAWWEEMISTEVRQIRKPMIAHLPRRLSRALFPLAD